MSALKYNSRIRIERKTGSRDPVYNTPLPDGWELFAEVWAEVQDVMPSRSEAVKNGLKLATDSARVRMRYLTGVTSDMRIVEKNNRKRVLKIVGGPAAITGMRELEMLVEGYSS